MNTIHLEVISISTKVSSPRLAQTLARYEAKKQQWVKAASALCPKLFRSADKSSGAPEIWAEVVEESNGSHSVFFKGGRHGDHSISAESSDRERILAHWDGYQSSNGHRPFKVGDRVMFHGSPIDRVGLLAQFTGTRGLVCFRYKHGGEGQRWREVRDLHHHGT